MDHLDELESRSVYVIREAFHRFRPLGCLWSMGKDSTVLLHLVRKAFLGRFPLAVSMTLADGRDVADQILPQGARGWLEGYLGR